MSELRASEVGMLQRADVDMKAGRITINRVNGRCWLHLVVNLVCCQYH